MSKNYKRESQFDKKEKTTTTHEFPCICCKFALVFELSIYFDIVHLQQRLFYMRLNSFLSANAKKLSLEPSNATV